MLYDELWDIVDEAPADSTVHTKSVIDGVLESAFREAGTRYQDALKSVTPEGWTTSFLHSEAEVWAQLNMLRTNRDTVCAAKQALGQHDTDKKRPLDDADAETRRPQEDKRITPTEQTPDETAVQRAEAAAALFKKVVGGPPADQHAKSDTSRTATSSAATRRNAYAPPSGATSSGKSPTTRPPSRGYSVGTHPTSPSKS